MPLPNFKDFRKVWVEKTKSSHGHGGEGWEFGRCLWSPRTDKLGKRIYGNMTAAQDGDLVLHFYEDTPYGKESDHYFCGVSVVDGAVEVRDQQPPLPGEWAGRSQYYRISLRGFTSFAEALPLRKFVQQHDAQIIKALKGKPDQPFIVYKGHIRLAQGKYLSRCNHLLYQLLSSAIDEPVSLSPVLPKAPSAKSKGQQPKEPHFDYEEYVEGQRSKREAWFFSRNPRLVQDAKDHYDCQCQACSFRYEERYPEIGKGYIEVHHLNPLSERNTAENDSRLTSLAQVTVLCANCHRMIHRLIRKLRRPVSVKEFQSHVT
jgi:predicted HNH restriction endonuclease